MAKAAAPTISPAHAQDLPALVAILAQDEQGGHGDHWSLARAPAYAEALREVLAEPGSILRVARDSAGQPLGLLHLLVHRILPGGGPRVAQVISLFVAAQARGQGVGAALLADAEALARARGASVVSLVSNKVRLDAHRFYRAQGYEQRHEGFKKKL